MRMHVCWHPHLSCPHLHYLQVDSPLRDRTPLCCATDSGLDTVVEALLAGRAEVDKQLAAGGRALLRASALGHVAVATLLLEVRVRTC